MVNSKNWIWMICVWFIVGCASNQMQPNSLSGWIDLTSTDFFEDLGKLGTQAQSGFTLFVPEASVHKRHARQLREILQQNMAKAQTMANLNYQSAADRVFFLSQQPPQNWKVPQIEEHDPSILSREFQNGTKAGWTVLHAYWGQMNHLLMSGDAAFIHSLPGSLRADMIQPLKYVLKVEVAYEEELKIASHVHKLTFTLVEIGTEKVTYTKSYSITLTTRIT